MSLATTELIRPSSAALAPAPSRLTATQAPVAHVAPVHPAPVEPATPRLRAVPSGTEPRGFVLYVGVDELKAAAAGTDLGHLVEALKKLTAELVPTA
jgi:hypothetical protein